MASLKDFSGRTLATIAYKSGEINDRDFVWLDDKKPDWFVDGNTYIKTADIRADRTYHFTIPSDFPKNCEIILGLIDGDDLYIIKKNGSKISKEIIYKLEEVEKIGKKLPKLDLAMCENYDKTLRSANKLLNEARENGFGRQEFFKWYFAKDKKCYFCGFAEEDLCCYFDEGIPEDSENKRNRGKILEIEKVKSTDTYRDGNCELACYICNNAKSDFISAADFKKYIAPGITNFWNSKILKRQKNNSNLN